MPSLPRSFALSALLIACLAAPDALAAPRAQSALECGIAADMAVVARSLAAAEIDRPKADNIMARIYEVSASERGRELMKQITDAAYAVRALHERSAAGGGSVAAGTSAHEFAEKLYATCLGSGGNMDPVLGERL